MVDAYQLAPNHDNQAGYVVMDEFLVSGERIAHVSSLGTFATAVEIVTLDRVVHDDGFDEWQWAFAAMTPEQVAEIEDTFLDGERSGPVTVMTKNRRGEWVERNATLSLQRLPTRRGEKYGDMVFYFTGGEALA